MSTSQKNKNVLIIVAHPSENSLANTLSNRTALKYKNKGYQVEIANLNTESFSPVMRKEDLVFYSGENIHIEDVTREQQRVDRADILVFVFPVYWWSVPAILKGWFDRVLTRDWAYEITAEGKIKGLFRNKPVKLIATAGGDKDGFDRHGYTQSINTQIIDGTFKWCGLDDVELKMFFDADSANDEAIERFFSENNFAD